MFFQKLLNKIPFFRNRQIKKIKEDLVEIQRDFGEGFFNDRYIISLHNILNNSLMDFSDDLVSGSLNKFSSYTKSSMSALKLIDKPELKKTRLEKSNIVSLTKETDYFSAWYSNEESVREFIDKMSHYIVAQVWLATPNPDYEAQEKIDHYISELNNEVFDSLIYRLLLEDLVSIVSFYIESKYE
ncbi:hypothetical protein OBP_272 [Pseudomonas phage OBP]|uniref:hypothetical protein n=1 Tax=Pseudomonas phage OBP TaxID=1124849 RepID=UPI000240D5F9|nr:hypothetical protein OBP_272 [Pseudomonas phage OBP]AEV89709.1 hypothetical protein OBP_272 [Pseudomonas phage OBP]